MYLKSAYIRTCILSCHAFYYSVHGEDLEDFTTVLALSVRGQVQCVTVPIIRDDVFEEEEFFSVNLTLLTSGRQITLLPDVTFITIIGKNMKIIMNVHSH